MLACWTQTTQNRRVQGAHRSVTGPLSAASARDMRPSARERVPWPVWRMARSRMYTIHTTLHTYANDRVHAKRGPHRQWVITSGLMRGVRPSPRAKARIRRGCALAPSQRTAAGTARKRQAGAAAQMAQIHQDSAQPPGRRARARTARSRQSGTHAPGQRARAKAVLAPGRRAAAGTARASRQDGARPPARRARAKTAQPPRRAHSHRHGGALAPDAKTAPPPRRRASAKAVRRRRDGALAPRRRRPAWLGLGLGLVGASYG